MYWAILDDGRHVIVTNGKTRRVGRSDHFLTPDYVEAILDGGYQTVKKSRLKPLEFGNPFNVIKR